MNDHTNHPVSSRLASDAAPTPESAFPKEPFECPYCGQMLAATCRVCVACRQPIDPAKIRTAQVEERPAATEAHPGGRVRATVRFPWPLFLALLAARMLVAGLIDQRWGFVKAELILGSGEMICAAWVFYDAARSGVPMPFRWAWGTLLLWPIVFPWYLVRRKAPRAACPIVEGIALPIILVILLALGMLFFLIKGPIG